MDIEKLFSTVTDQLKVGASIETVYGKPIEIAGKTIIPVAKVAYGFGAGGGEGSQAPAGEQAAAGSGMGGGGWARAKPVAVIEITQGQTRVIPIIDFGRIAALGFAAAVIAAIFMRRR
ncbi:MAG: hypothetical protein M1389_05425 [Chloroflexi bacterium]|nr:hypothetical protein [Chloroflexota bacterium]MCL5025818.1 hypothetical protein [Chloroflexota bacterium]